jgi:hypothetical protein
LPGLDWSADGCAALSGELLERAVALDRQFRDWALELGASEHRFPSLLPASGLAPIGYLASFPHLATFATSGDRGKLDVLAAEHGESAAVPTDQGLLAPATHLLTPAACYHIYYRMQGQEFDKPQVMTTHCLCHRVEEEYQPLRRQWSFEMREIVCIGDDTAIESFVDTLQEKIDSLAVSFGLAVDWRVATDPFFAPGKDSKALAQMVAPTKRELCLADGLAIASINRHRSFFGEAYDIRYGNEPARSACIAFGIERWLFALLEQQQ